LQLTQLKRVAQQWGKIVKIFPKARGKLAACTKLLGTGGIVGESFGRGRQIIAGTFVKRDCGMGALAPPSH
jgi:hypothetical protein